MAWQGILAILTSSVLLMSISYTMLIPFLPMYLITELGVSDASVNIWSGVIFSVSFIVSAVMAPIWGRMADTRGRKAMALRSGISLAITYFLCGIVQSPLQLLLARALQGFAAGLWPAELAIMSSYAPKEKTGFCMGCMQGALTGGAVIGPLLGGVLAHYFGMRMAFFVASGALALITVITMLFIKEPPRQKDVSPQDRQDKKQESLLKVPVIRDLLLCTVVIQMAVLILQPIMTLYVAQLHHSMDNVVMLSGIIFSLGGFAGAISSPLWGKLGQKKGFLPIMCLTLAATGVVMILQALPNNLQLFAFCQFLGGWFYAGVYPSINSLLIENSQEQQRGRVFGLMFGAQQIGSTVGPLIGGIIATYFQLYWVFIFAGILVLLTGGKMYFFPPKGIYHKQYLLSRHRLR